MRLRLNAAENSSLPIQDLAVSTSFNEAAAERRGKHELGQHLAVGLVASMRPRLNAAENPDGKYKIGVMADASMRPRLNAAENSNPSTAVRTGSTLLQ